MVLLGFMAIHYGLPGSTTLHDHVPVTLKKNYVHPTGGGHIIFVLSGVPLGFQTF